MRVVKSERPDARDDTVAQATSRLFPATDAKVEPVILSLKCPLGIPPGAIPENADCAVDGHNANSNAVGFDLSQGTLNEGVAFYLVLDRGCRVVQPGERT